jgi:prepilin-type N-terminal cleavage/methylation domain-containing protein
MRHLDGEAGFNLIEVLVAMGIMLLISGAATTALLKMGTTQATIWNRTQMHSGIRGATEVLQQEVGQAGRVALPGTVTLSNTYAAGQTTLAVSSSSGMFAGEKLTVGSGDAQETVTVASVPSTTSITLSAGTTAAHAASDPVQVLGGFAAGIVPPAASPWSYTNGSTAAVLKLFGDINADGKMVYIEYSVSPACICTASCSPHSTTGNLYRNSMDWNAATKTAASASQILLGNITENPNGSACFTYQPSNVVIGGVTTTYVTDVAVTLTVQTQLIDPVTKSYQTETKALLNVSPRNVFNVWQLASLGYTQRIQPVPAAISALLAGSGS